MYKFFTVVLILLSSNSGHAKEMMEHLLPTQQLVKSKLWFEGIENIDEKSRTYRGQNAAEALPEELAIALDQLEAQWDS